MTEALNKSATPPEAAKSIGAVTLSREVPTAEEQTIIKTRNTWLDAKLDDDPERPLPEITLRVQDLSSKKHDLSKEDFGQPPSDPQPRVEPLFDMTSYAIDNNEGKKVGYIDLVSPRGNNRMNYINNVAVFGDSDPAVDPETERGKGYGPAAYLALLKSLPAGQGLETKGPLREGSLKMWERLVEKGVAREIESPEPGKYKAFGTVF